MANWKAAKANGQADWKAVKDAGFAEWKAAKHDGKSHWKSDKSGLDVKKDSEHGDFEQSGHQDD
ncbi:MAG: hypothetical protein ACQEXN_18285 [Actinomycetota bacterium]